MRIVGGLFKGKKINFLNEKITRPLRDLVKESIFNILEHSNLIKVKINTSAILDLYSGIGSFGIECISRGAKEVCFVENNYKAINVLKQNNGKYGAAGICNGGGGASAIVIENI